MIERACCDNVLFIALIGDAKPRFITIADFVSRLRSAVAPVFSQLPTLLGKEGLRGRELAARAPHVPCGWLAHDGVELPSNASKHRSGTHAEYAHAQKMEHAAKTMLDHRCADE
ncbi:MAG: hypothetical protein ABIO49_02330 [Dokdonella sp.]